VNILGVIGAVALAPLAQAGFVTLEEPIKDHAEAGRFLRARTSLAFRWILLTHEIQVPRAGVVELSPDARPHLHLITRPPAITEGLFQEACARQGLGMSRLEKVRGEPRLMARYIYKTVLPEPAAPFMADPEVLETFYRNNGGRAIHASGQFWLDPDGNVLRDGAQARKVAYRLWRDHNYPG